jgi:molybdopterin synthase sulfur carrier subunit
VSGTASGAVTVRYWASARAAAGCAEESVAAGSLAAVAEICGARHGERLARVLSYSSFLVDGSPLRDRDAVLAPGTVVEVLPPFAGG